MCPSRVDRLKKKILFLSHSELVEELQRMKSLLLLPSLLSFIALQLVYYATINAGVRERFLPQSFMQRR
jgi:hypothetical protein